MPFMRVRNCIASKIKIYVSLFQTALRDSLLKRMQLDAKFSISKKDNNKSSGKKCSPEDGNQQIHHEHDHQHDEDSHQDDAKPISLSTVFSNCFPSTIYIT